MEFLRYYLQQARDIIQLQLKLLNSTSEKQQIDLSQLAAEPHEKSKISPVEYAHDPVPNAPAYLAISNFPFPTRVSRSSHLNLAFGIRLRPQLSLLPYRCSLDATYESRFWRSGLESSRNLLQLLADDRSATDIVVGDGITMAKLAQKTLKAGLGNGFCKAATYMYPFSDEERTRLLSSTMVMMFLFDDKGEETTEATLKPFLDDFVQRLRKENSKPSSDSELQKHIDAVVRGFQEADSRAGNAGREVIEAMSLSFQCLRPEREFQTLAQYLEFRRDNVGAHYVIAAIKFSIGSSVAIADTRLTRYLTLIKDHLAIVNDMASFDKEKRDFDNGLSRDLINIINIVQRLLSLPDIQSSKAIAYTYQLQVEAWMREELQRLDEQENLDSEQWRFLEATYVCAAGNAFFSMTTLRYGGSSAKIV